MLNYNPYNPYAVRRRVIEPPGYGRSFAGPVVAAAPGASEQLGVPVAPGV